MIDRNQRTLLSLIKASLSGLTPELPENTNWNAVLREADAQTVTGLVASAIPKTEAEMWKKPKARCEANFIRILHGQTQLVELFEHEGIPLVIMKGMAAAMYYPIPSQRTMGDIDFLVPQECFERAARLMERDGYMPQQELQIYLNVKHKIRHITFFRNGVEYELHHHFSSTGVDIENVLIAGLRCAERAKIGGVYFPVLPPRENGLLLLAHAYYHFLTAGLGLRQVIDWMMFVKSAQDDMILDNEFSRMIDDAGLSKFAAAMTALCRDYLGLTGSYSSFETMDKEIVDALLKHILEHGNFGRRSLVPQKVESMVTNIRARGFISCLSQTGAMIWNSPSVQKSRKALRPFVWIKKYSDMIRKRLSTGAGNYLVQMKKGVELSRLYRSLKMR